MGFFTLATLTKTEDTVELGMPDETLAECLARIKRDYPTMTMGRNHFESSRFSAERAYYRYGDRPDRSLNLGEVFAAWTTAQLDALDSEWGDRIDVLLAGIRENTIDHGEYSRAAQALDLSIGVRRTNVTKAAYGITYKEFVA